VTSAGRCHGFCPGGAEAGGGPGGELPGVERGQQFLPGGFGGGVVADLVQQVPGEFFGAGAMARRQPRVISVISDAKCPVLRANR